MTLVLQSEIPPESPENPMHMMRLIIEMESSLTPQSVMSPMTPASMEMIENATQSEHSGLGIKIKLITIITPAATVTHCTVVGNTEMNCNK